MLLKTSVVLPNLLTRVLRSKGGIWFPEVDHVADPSRNVLALVTRPDGGRILVPAANIVTDAGDLHYAQRCAGETPTNAFTYWEMGSAGTPGKSANRSNFTPIASSGQAQDAGYPKTNDGDADNTGAGTDVRTTRVSYTAAAFSHAAITHGVVTNTSPGASEAILSGWAWAASINKTSADTLKCFLNHTLNGI